MIIVITKFYISDYDTKFDSCYWIKSCH